MGAVPDTSVSMLKAISRDASSARWVEFVQKYESAMRGFLHERFPSVEPEDAMQDTLLALVKALPNYRYTPDAKGHFRNYLMGILSHKAADIVSRRARQARLASRLAGEAGAGMRMAECESADDESWKAAAMEVALEQLMADDGIQPSTKEVFRHVALMHERPEDVAKMFGLTRNNVDQIKKRMIGRLASMVRDMTAAGISAS